MFTNILVPLDGSELAEAILPKVESVANAFNASVSLMRSYHAVGDDAVVKAMREAEDYIKGVEEKLNSRGLKVSGHTRFNADAAEAVIDHCNQYGTDLIMMSTHGRGGVIKVLLGSVAEKLVHNAAVPIFLMPCRK